MLFYKFEGKRPYADPEAFVHPQAVLIGDVIVEAGCYIGAGTVLRGDIGYIRVGRESNVEENSAVMGSPARAIKKIGQEQLERISTGLSIYQDLTRRHLKSLKQLPDSK